MAQLPAAQAAMPELQSSPLAASPTGAGTVRIPPLKMGALVVPPDGTPVGDRVAPLIKPSDANGAKVAVVKSAVNSVAGTLQGRDVDVLANAATRLGVELTETTSSSGRRALVLEGNNPQVMGVVRMAKAIKEDRASRPFLVGYSATGPVYQAGPHLFAAPGGLVAMRRDGANLVPMGVIAPTGSVAEIGEFVMSASRAVEGLING